MFLYMTTSLGPHEWMSFFSNACLLLPPIHTHTYTKFFTELVGNTENNKPVANLAQTQRIRTLLKYLDNTNNIDARQLC